MVFLFLCIILFTTPCCSPKNSTCMLLSYPRSGNTFTRYCIEVITKRKTIDPDRTHSIAKNINKAYANHIDDTKPYIYKVHELDRMPGFSGIIDCPVILLLRNPKEAVISHATNKLFTIPIDPLYYDILRHFDRALQEKLLIYYEDLISDTETQLRKIVQFLSDDPENEKKIQMFMIDINEHTANSIMAYKKSKGRSWDSGRNPYFYSSRYYKQDRLDYDSLVRQKYSYLWKKYLLRYQEPSD